MKEKDFKMKFKCDEIGEFYDDKIMCVLDNEIAVLTNSGESINVNLSSIKNLRCTLQVDNNGNLLYEGDELKILDKSTGEDFVRSIRLFNKGWGVSIKDTQIHLSDKEYTFVKTSSQHGTHKPEIKESSAFPNVEKKCLEDYEVSGLYSTDQLEQIELGLDLGIDVSLYSNPQFDSLQMEQIRFGGIQDLDVSKYNSTEFNYAQMEEIRLGLSDNLTISYYADRKFSYEQMRQIRLGLLSGINILYYADTKYSPQEMYQTRLRLEYDLRL